MRCCVVCALLLLAACARPGPQARYPCEEPPLSTRISIDGPCAWRAHSQSLVVVDSVVVGRYWEVNEGRLKLRLTPEQILSLEIVKGPAAIALYGPQASRGVLLIRTRKPAEPDSVAQPRT